MGSPAAGGPGVGPLRHMHPAAPTFRYPFQNGKLRLVIKSPNTNGAFNSPPRSSMWTATAPNSALTNGPGNNTTLQPRMNDRNNSGHKQQRKSPQVEAQQQTCTSPPANGGAWRPNNGCNYEPRDWNFNGMRQRFGFDQFAGNMRFPSRQNHRYQPYQAHASNYQPRHCRNNNVGPRFQNHYNDKPWVTPELKEMIRQRNVLQKRVQLLRNPKEWQEFKELRQKTANLLNAAKFDYEIQLSSQPKSERIFYCDTCDKTCLNQKGLDEHKAEHIVCKLDGCMFTAHPKVVLKHIQMQHATNLFHRINGYKTEDEIKQWIDDRKKNFPTATNLKRKKTAASERQARGERFPRIPKFRYPINQAQKVKDKYNKDNRRRNVKGVYQGTHNSLTNVNKYDGQDYIHSKNTSPMVTLENYYALVKVGEKRQLIGKKLTRWTETVRKVAVPEENSDNSADEEEQHDETNLSITDEEDEMADTRTDTPTTGHMTPKQGELMEESSVSITAEASTTAANKTSVGLAGLLTYGSGSESDGEIADSDSDNEPPDEMKIEHKSPSERDYQQNAQVQEKAQRRPVQSKSSNTATKVNSKQGKNAQGERMDNQPDPGVLKERLNKRRQHQRAQKLRKLALKKKLSNAALRPNDEEVEGESLEIGESVGCNPEEGKPLHAKNLSPLVGKSGKGWTGNKAVKPQLKPRPRWRPPTLLERLLADDIEREGNYLLQACRFVVQNNFFGVEDNGNDINPKKDS